jgi:two-component system response regulator HydG
MKSATRLRRYRPSCYASCKNEKSAVGGSTISPDGRPIAASSKDLAHTVQQEKFRAGLLRLAIVPLHLPALRERREDISLLAQHFIKKYCEREGMAPKELAASDLRRLMDAPWPGNVRELQNVIERAVVFSVGPVLNLQLALGSQDRQATSVLEQRAEHAPGPLKQATQAAQEQLEREQIIEALRQVQGNRSTAAALLGISRGRSINKLRRYGIGRRRSQRADGWMRLAYCPTPYTA